MISFVTLLLCGLTVLPLVSQAAGDAEAGKQKASICSGCHGVDGISITPIYPNLAGQKAPYLELALQAYKAKTRQGGNAVIMYSMVDRLSAQDIADLAAYFASLPPGGN